MGAMSVLPGCIIAQRRINANEAELYARAITETERIARQLENGGPGNYDVRFFSAKLLSITALRPSKAIASFAEPSGHRQ